jgi:hypothetical protein
MGASGVPWPGFRFLIAKCVIIFRKQWQSATDNCLNYRTGVSICREAFLGVIVIDE